MSYLQLCETITKPWSNANDIKKIAQCGRDNAVKIREAIQKEIIKSGKNIPYGKTKYVPTKMVIDYVGLDLNYIFDMAKSEKEISSQTC